MGVGVYVGTGSTDFLAMQLLSPLFQLQLVSSAGPSLCFNFALSYFVLSIAVFSVYLELQYQVNWMECDCLVVD